MRLLYLSPLLLLAACGSALTQNSKDNIRNAALLTAAEYRYLDAGTPEAALNRGAHCALLKVIQTQGLDPIDGGVSCLP